MAEAVVVAGVLFLGALVRSFFGFGDAAVAMPLLALLAVPLDVAVPLVGLAGMAVALLAVARGWSDVDRRALLALTLSTIVGVPVGVLLVTHMSEPALQRSLGLLLVGYGAYLAAGRRLPRPLLRRSAWAYPFGFAAGALGGAYNFNGVPVAVYGTLRRWPPERFRGTLQAHFLVSSILVVTGQAAGGLWTVEVLRSFAAAAPGVLVAVPLGSVLHRRVSAPAFTRLVHGLIVVLGLVLLVR